MNLLKHLFPLFFSHEKHAEELKTITRKVRNIEDSLISDWKEMIKWYEAHKQRVLSRVGQNVLDKKESVLYLS